MRVFWERLMRMMWYEPEKVAYTVIATSLVTSYTLERWFPKSALVFYDTMEPTIADLSMVEELCKRIGLDPLAITTKIAIGERHITSIGTGHHAILFIPQALSHRARQRVQPSSAPRDPSCIPPLREHQIRALVAVELHHIQKADALAQYAAQMAVLGLTGAAVLAARRWRRRPVPDFVSTTLSIVPILSAMSVEIWTSRRQFQERSSVGSLSVEERASLVSALREEREHNLCMRNEGGQWWKVTPAGNDWLDLARPWVTTRLSLLDEKL